MQRVLCGDVARALLSAGCDVSHRAALSCRHVLVDNQCERVYAVPSRHLGHYSRFDDVGMLRCGNAGGGGRMRVWLPVLTLWVSAVPTVGVEQCKTAMGGRHSAAIPDKGHTALLLAVQYFDRRVHPERSVLLPSSALCAVVHTRTVLWWVRLSSRLEQLDQPVSRGHDGGRPDWGDDLYTLSRWQLQRVNVFFPAQRLCVSVHGRLCPRWHSRCARSWPPSFARCLTSAVALTVAPTLPLPRLFSHLLSVCLTALLNFAVLRF